MITLVSDYLGNFLGWRGSKVVSCDGHVVRNCDGRDERGDVLELEKYFNYRTDTIFIISRS